MRAVVVVLFLLLPLTATAQPHKPWPDALCDGGEPWACAESGTRLARQGADGDAMRRFWRACAADDPDGCDQVAQMLEAGRAGGFDVAEARAQAKAACDKGQARACLALGHLHTLGVGQAVDHEAARRLYTSACSKDAWTCTGLAWQLELGLGVTEDAAHAAKLYRKACDAKNLRGGCRNIARLVAPREAASVRDRACKAGEPVACYQLGRHDRACKLGVSASCREHARALIGKGDVAGAEAPYGLACGVGDAAACGELGVLRINAGDATAAAKHLETGCAAKDAPSCLYLGLLLVQGNGVKADPARAIAAWRVACDAGLHEACGQLGVALVKGVGGTADPSAGFTLVQRACDGGLAASCADLGVLYHDGTGVKADPAKSRASFEKACAGGHADACRVAKAPAAQAPVSKPKAKAAASFGDPTELMKEVADLEARCERTRDGSMCHHAAMRLRRTAWHRQPDREKSLFAKGCQLGHGDSCAEADDAATLQRGCDLSSGTACERLARRVGTSDRARAEALYLRACDLGTASGCVLVAARAEGAGRRDDARRYYDLGCTRNDPLGCTMLGDLLRKSGDATAARAAYRKGCDLKYADACERLGKLE